jgi:alanine racemase
MTNAKALWLVGASVLATQLAGCSPALGDADPRRNAAPDIAARVQGYESWIEVDLDAIGSNLAEIRRHTGVEVMPVVKNNAYGHGLVPVVSYLTKKQGVNRVFVALFREALEIRDAGLTCAIVNMGPLFSPEDYRRAVDLDITQTVFTEEAARNLSEAAQRAGKTAGIFVKVDTGLRRVGVFHDEAADFIERVAALPGIRIDGIFSSFMQVPEQDRLQLQRFLAVEARLKERGVSYGVRSMASTDAVFHFPDSHLDLVRPGMSLYGVYPEAKDRNVPVKLKQALTLKARVELVKWVNQGDSVTYWGRFIAPSRMMIGTVHAGFFDGLPRELANKGRVHYEGAYRPMVGSISLNHVLVDLTGTTAAPGDVVDIIGREGDNSLSEVSTTAGWMVYSLLNHLNVKTPRVYVEGGQPVELLAP